MSDAEHTRGQIYPIRGGKNGTLPPAGLPRRLAAIVAADIAGYSRLMGRDEEGTHARIKRHRRELIEPSIAEHHGKLIKYTGDGFLAMFDSPVEAVRCAIVIQQSMVGRNASLPLEQRILYRIGIHLGDVIIEPEDIYGEGVNIAARLEGIARPGDLYISGGVYEQIKNKLVCAYQSLGDRQVKNITDPVTVYRVLPDPAALVDARKFNKLVGAVISCVLLLPVLPADTISSTRTTRRSVPLFRPARSFRMFLSPRRAGTTASGGNTNGGTKELCCADGTPEGRSCSNQARSRARRQRPPLTSDAADGTDFRRHLRDGQQ